MKKRNWPGLLLLLMLLVGCSATPAATSEPAPAAAVVEVGNTSANAIEGLVVPSQQSTLSFLVSGPVAEISVSEGDHVEAGDPLLTLTSVDLDSQVSNAEAALRAAVADLQYWLIARKNKPPERRWLAEDRVDAANAAVETALASQKQKTLLAPYAATVIEVKVAPGEVVNAQQAVILLANLKDLQIETTDLSERDVVNIKVGQPARVYIEALDAEIIGTVTNIATLASDYNGDVVYTATIQLDEIPAALRWGMSVEIDFGSE